MVYLCCGRCGGSCFYMAARQDSVIKAEKTREMMDSTMPAVAMPVCCRVSFLAFTDRHRPVMDRASPKRAAHEKTRETMPSTNAAVATPFAGSA